MNLTGEETIIPNRRQILGMLAGVVVSAALPNDAIAQSIENIISTESFDDFRIRLQGYSNQDNWRPDGVNGQNRGNMWKYQELAKPLIDGGLSQLDVQKMQYLISQEVGSAYDTSQVSGFRKYDEQKIYDENIFYGDIPGTPSIRSQGSTIYDSRLSGQIDFDSPADILTALNLPANQEDVAFVIKDSNGVFCFMYYEGGTLKAACPCSPGSTIFGAGAITPSSGLEYNEYSDISHYFLDDDMKGRSSEQLNSVIRNGNTIGGSMPYARRVLKDGKVDGYYTHIGKVTGKAESHGCIRLPAFWAYMMFYEANNGTKIHYRPDYSLPAEV